MGNALHDDPLERKEPIPTSDRLVGLAGDWHGSTRWASSALNAFRKAGVRSIFHVGDFGLWLGHAGSMFLEQLEASCQRFDLRIFVTPGNHEDWNVLDSIFELGSGPQPVTEHIHFIPRGWRWSIFNRKFVSLGGAPSIDHEFRTSGVDWWPSEVVTDADVDAVIAGGSADVMLTHDAPEGGTPKVDEIVADNPLGYSLQARAYAGEGRERMTQAFNAVKPRLLVHGHYHVYDEVIRKPTKGRWGHRILSLDCEDTPGNAVILDLADLSTARLRVAW